MDPALRDTITKVAREEGVDPAYALAVAERESNFNPKSGGTGSIRGLYQMTGANRKKFGVADDAEAQTRGFARFTKDLREEMKRHLGRDPTNSELYVGHYWGGARASRVIDGRHADLAPSDVFSANELKGNPNLAKGKTVGDLARSITADMDKRQAKFGGTQEPPRPPGKVEFAQFGQPAEDIPKPSQAAPPGPPNGGQMAVNPPARAAALPPAARPTAASPPPDSVAAAPAQPAAALPPLPEIDIKVNKPAKPDFAEFGAPAPEQKPPTTSFASTNEGAKINTPPRAFPFDPSSPEAAPVASPENSGKKLRPGTEVDLAELDAPAPPAPGTKTAPVPNPPIDPQNPYYPDIARGVA